MQRENKFRGKSKDNGEWVYGDLCTQHAVLTALIGVWDSESMTCNWHPVLPETVGQYTGLKDKNGKEVYQDDVVKTWVPTTIQEWRHEVALRVVFKNGCFCAENDRRSIPLHDICCSNPLNEFFECEIIGNAYENADLIATS